MSDMIIKPRMSEKTYAQSTSGVYVFDVPTSANKHEIATAVEKAFDVTVVNVRTTTLKGKAKRLYRNRRFENGVRNDVKKAYVQLKSGDTIPVFAAIEEAEAEAQKTEKKADKKAKKEEKK